MSTPNVSYWNVWRKLRDDIIYEVQDSVKYEHRTQSERINLLQAVYNGPILDPLEHPFRHDR